MLLTLPILIALGSSFVVLFLAFGEADFQFHASAGVVQVERNEGIAGALDLADQFADFLGMEQQLADA